MWSKTSMFLLTQASLLLTTHGHPYPKDIGLASTSTSFCFESSECADSLYLSESSGVTADECASNCAGAAFCQFFTYYPDSNKRCVLFADCEQPSDQGCDGRCYSGNKECTGLPCYNDDQCEGDFVSQATRPSEKSCLEDCQADPECVWFNYNASDGACILLKDCPFVTTDICPDGQHCTKGHELCDSEEANDAGDTTPTSGEEAALTKIMVFGGYAGSYLDSVEVVDLTDPNGGCEKAPLPHPTRGQYVAMVKGPDGQDVVQMCGGYQVTDEDSTIVDTCYQYDPSSDQWTELHNQYSLRRRRGYGASATVDGDWVVTGGYYEYTTTEFMAADSESSKFLEGPDMPNQMTDHCIAHMGDDNRLLFAGFGEGVLSLILDWKQKTFTPAGFTSHSRSASACGFARDASDPSDQGRAVFVSQETSDVYSVGSGQWTEGPTLDNVGRRLGSAQLEDTFVVVGGESDDGPTTYLGTLFAYEEVSGSEPKFTELLPRLMIPRSYVVALAVPEDFVSCP